MLRANEALGWKNTGLLAMFGLRLGDDREGRAPKTALEEFFDQAKLCAAAPWWGWGLIDITCITRADQKQDRPLHLIYAHPQGLYFDLAYCPRGAPWSVRLRAIPDGIVQRTMLERGIGAVIGDMRRSLAGFNQKMMAACALNGRAHEPVQPAAPPKRRRQAKQQTKPNRARAVKRH